MTDFSRIDAYVLRLIEESEPERTAWNLEKIREGKKVTWNYIDGCMLTALMEMTSITGDERYAAFAEQVIDHFVQEDGNILTLQPEKANLDDINEGRVLFSINVALYLPTLYRPYTYLYHINALILEDHPKYQSPGV